MYLQYLLSSFGQKMWMDALCLFSFVSSKFLELTCIGFFFFFWFRFVQTYLLSAHFSIKCLVQLLRIDPDGEFSIEKVEDPGGDVKPEKATDLDNGSSPKNASLREKQFSQEKNSTPGDNFALDNVGKSDISVAGEVSSQDKDVAISQVALSPIVSDTNWTNLGTLGSNLSNPLISVAPNRPSLPKQTTEIISKAENLGLLQSGPGTLNESSTTARIPLIKKKKKKQIVPPTSIPEMTRLLLRNRVSFRSMVMIQNLKFWLIDLLNKGNDDFT